MGDTRRHHIFTTFIQRRFRDVGSILEIAGGKGKLARKLANKGYSVIVIDSRPRFEGKNHKRITFKKATFSENYNRLDCDLIIGMHPDETTGEIIRYAGKYRIQYAIVPCCHVGRDSKNIGNYWEWLTKLKKLAKDNGLTTNEFTLRMNGKNIVLFGKPKRVK